MSKEPETTIQMIECTEDDRREFWNLIREYAERNNIPPLKLAVLTMQASQGIMHDLGVQQIEQVVAVDNEKDWN